MKIFRKFFSWYFEDLLLTFERDAANYCIGSPLRSNRQISPAALSGDVKDAFAAQFLQAEPNLFQRGRDRLALISVRHDDKVTKAVQSLCEAARGFAVAVPKQPTRSQSSRY